jgi:predicted DNA-binding protein YlxM (UPF0122 family)
MSENLYVPKEFFEGQLGQTMPKSEKSGGPYPTHAKKARRDEVFRLHFNYGYSARKIAEMIKINRNTINSDITYWYSQLQKEDSKVSVEDWINKMIYRLETKRARLMERLDKATSLEDFLILEKMLFVVDNKIIQIVIKIQNTNQSIFDRTTNMFNNWLEEHGYKERYVLWGQTLRVTSGTQENIKRLIQSDKYQKPIRSKNNISRSSSHVAS